MGILSFYGFKTRDFLIRFLHDLLPLSETLETSSDSGNCLSELPGIGGLLLGNLN